MFSGSLQEGEMAKGGTCDERIFKKSTKVENNPKVQKIEIFETMVC